MNVVYIILLLAAVVCFLAATFRVPSKVELIALGLALATAVPLIIRIRAE